MWALKRSYKPFYGSLSVIHHSDPFTVFLFIWKVRFLFCHCHFSFMPFPVLFPCHILASVFHVCPRVQYSVLRFRFLLTFFLSFRDFPQKMATALSENPASVIHSINLAHNTLDNQGTCIKVSFFLLYLSLSPSSLSIYLSLSVFYTLCISMCICYFCLWVGVFFLLFFLVFALLTYCAVSVADLKMGSLRCVCALLFLMCVFLCSFECAVQ